ncbi:MAG: hypothetical protein HY738_04875 [Bacteroidia bacterium]|nr:hypothetical protein [Bacteroidia bacterium]
MKYINKISVLLLLAFAGMISTAVAQNANKIIIKDKENVFKESDGKMISEFVIKGFDKSFDTKQITVDISAIPGVKKFGIKNHPAQNTDERDCVLILESETYLNVFRQVLTQLQVKSAIINDKEMELNEFIELFK